MKDESGRPFRRLLAHAVRALGAIELRDVAGLSGVGLIAAGAWEIYHPAGLIVGGAFLIAGAILHARPPAAARGEA